MKVFLDCEFQTYGTKAYLISIALVDEEGNAFYGEVKPVIAGGNTWLDEYVYPKLWVVDKKQREGHDKGVTYIAGSEFEIASMMEGWLKERGQESNPIQVVSDVYATDWQLFCNAFGGIFDMPGFVHYIPLDLATMLYSWGEDPDVNRDEFAREKNASLKHNALWDARVLKKCWERLDKDWTRRV